MPVPGPVLGSHHERHPMPSLHHRTGDRCPSTPSRLRRSWLAGALAAVLTLAGILPGLAAVSAAAAAPTPEVASLAPWLANQLTSSSGVLNTSSGGMSYPDYGLTADAVLGLAAMGEGKGAADQATEALEEHVADYSGDSTTILYAGATAKLLLVAEAHGTSTSSFGGRDLVAQLQDLQVTSGSATGRFSDRWVPGYKYPGGYDPSDYSNSLVQALAIIALNRAGITGTPVDDAATYLALQQCPNGGLRVTEGDAQCTDDTAADPDITGVALQAFVAAGHNTAADKADGWLLAQQRGDGSFASSSQDPTTPTPNANTTAVIEGGLLAHGDTLAGARARAYLSGLQLGCAARPPDRGAVAYDTTDRDAAVFGGGISAQTLDQFRRASAQAAMGLASTSYLEVDGAAATPDAPQAACTTPLLTAAYRGVLNRLPDSSGLAYWKQRLAGGTSPLVMVATLAASPEAAQQVVTIEYDFLLNRAPDADGLPYWAQQFQRTARADVIAAAIVASPERFNADGGQNWQWVQKSLYETILGREPDLQGLFYWTDQANRAGPAGRATIVAPFLPSDEGTAVLIRKLDRQVCGDTTPLAASRVSQLATGLRATALNPLLTRTAIVFGGC